MALPSTVRQSVAKYFIRRRSSGRLLRKFGRKDNIMEPSNKKAWDTPSLTEYGDAATLTLVKDKHVGVSDGFTFNGTPISG